MVKNWIILGDEAFENSDYVWGRVHLSRKQQGNWQSIVMEQLNSAIEKSAKVREMIDNNNSIEFDFDFFEKPKVTEEDIVGFLMPLAERFWDKEILYRVSYNREFSCVSVNIKKVNILPEEEDPEVEENVCIDENGNPMPKRNGETVSFRDLAGEWTEYDYQDVKGKVEKDGQYIIILKEKEYDLEGIKHPNDDYDEYTSRELTTILKSSFLYFAEADQNTIMAMPDENYIKELIERAMKLFKHDIKSGGIWDKSLLDCRPYPFLNFCSGILDIIESKEAKKTIEQRERKKLEDGKKAIQEILNSDTKNLNEEEIEHLNKLLEELS